LPNLQNNSISYFKKHQFWLFVISAIVLLQIPILSLPFKWLESYFHEISHGLSALISGGGIVKIELFPNGAGLCTTRGGSILLISFMGYAGAILWGSLIYSIASISQKTAKFFSSLIILLIVFSLIFWVRDLLTLVIVLVILGLFLLKLKLPNTGHLQKILKLTGMMVLLNSFLSPLYLLDGRSIGDGARLSEITLIPELIWVIIWSVSAVFALIVLSKQK
jgi:hypothetical protein